MNAFADTQFFLALVSPQDQSHERARTFVPQLRRIVTTEWVLVELGNALARPPGRQQFVNTLELLARRKDTEVVPASSELYRRGVAFYTERADKSWSLTDCISFLVMRDRGLSDALTADRHFEQAGFRALLR